MKLSKDLVSESNRGHDLSRPVKSHLEIAEDFRCFDSDCDGRIDYAEFGEFMECLDARIAGAQLMIGFGEIDVDRDGLIDLSEFIKWWRRR